MRLVQCIAENKVAALLSGADSVLLNNARQCLQFHIVLCETEVSRSTAKCLTVAPSARRGRDVSADSFEMPLFPACPFALPFSSSPYTAVLMYRFIVSEQELTNNRIFKKRVWLLIGTVGSCLIEVGSEATVLNIHSYQKITQCMG